MKEKLNFSNFFFFFLPQERLFSNESIKLKEMIAKNTGRLISLLVFTFDYSFLSFFFFLL